MNGYDQDFYEWTKENARLLREGRFSEVDIDNLVEELEAMGRSEKRAFLNHLAVLIAHLLKWERQAALRSTSSKYTILEQRQQVADILDDNPSFKHHLDEMLPKAYGKAIIRFVKETGLDGAVLPRVCPYEFDKIMDTRFFPEENS